MRPRALSGEHQPSRRGAHRGRCKHHDEALRDDLCEALEDVVADVAARRTRGSRLADGLRRLVGLVQLVRVRPDLLGVVLEELDRRGVGVVHVHLWRRRRWRSNPGDVDPRASRNPLELGARRRLTRLPLLVLDHFHGHLVLDGFQGALVLDRLLVQLVVRCGDLDLVLLVHASASDCVVGLAG